MDLQQKTALITGAASGIGRALAIELARNGCHLALVDRDAAGLLETAGLIQTAGLRVSTHTADLTRPEAIDALPAAVLAAHPSFELLINNAGITAGGRFWFIRPDTFNRVMDVNFNAVVQLTRACLPHLLERKEARIVNISSVYGLLGGRDQTAYAASKFAVNGFSQALRFDLAGTRVGVSVVFPGGVSTAIVKNAELPDGMSPEQVAKRKAREEKLLKMKPGEAARALVNGIKRNRDRIVIGRDAWFMDLLARFFPSGYAVLMRGLSGKSSSGKTP